MLPLVMPAALAIAREFMPDLAGALRRPGGRALAESVVTAAAAAAGVSPESDPQQIIQRVRENPAAMDDLRLELEQLDADKEIYLAEIGDRASARANETARGEDGLTRGNWMIAGVSLGLLGCVVGAIWGLQPDTQGKIDTGVLALLTTVAGALLKMLSDAFSYEFGSSRGSKDKTADLLRVTSDNRQATARAVQSAQTQAASVAARVAQATTSALTTGAATAAVVAETVADTVAPKQRNFVDMLVRGEV